MGEIATKFGVSPDIVYTVKYRVGKMIEAAESEYAENRSFVCVFR